MPMDRDVRSRDAYLVKSVVHSSRLLTAFRSPGEALRLREIASRSGLPKTMVFRLLYTLEKCGMVEKVSENLYQSCLRPWKQRLYRLGYAAQGTDYQFSKEVSASLQRAATAEGIELISLDNRYSAKIAQRNPDLLVRPGDGKRPWMRLTGMLVGLNLVLTSVKNCPVTHLDGDGELGPSFEAVRKHLRSSRYRRQLVGAINDPSALGALRAFQEAGR